MNVAWLMWYSRTCVTVSIAMHEELSSPPPSSLATRPSEPSIDTLSKTLSLSQPPSAPSPTPLPLPASAAAALPAPTGCGRALLRVGLTVVDRLLRARSEDDSGLVAAEAAAARAEAQAAAGAVVAALCRRSPLRGWSSR